MADSKRTAEVSVLLLLGSNIYPEINLPCAVKRLAEHPRVTVLKASSVWESAPLGFTEQTPFCNGAVLLQTAYPAREFKFQMLRSIEDGLGRVRDPANKNGPRTIDLDIGYFGTEVIAEEGLTIPDPEISQRPFLAIPAAELLPDFLDPLSGLTLQTIADSVSGREQLKLRSDIRLLFQSEGDSANSDKVCN